MAPVSFANKTYQVDTHGFLQDHAHWDEGFAQALAPSVQIPDGLTEEHWKVLRFIRDTFLETGACPLVYQTCRRNGLFLRQLQKLFPTGYLRGACKLAGITYNDRFINYFGEESPVSRPAQTAADALHEKSYLTNAAGFLIDPNQWDEHWARNKAAELGTKNLSPDHWKIIRFLRKAFQDSGQVPTVYETCEKNQIELEQLERLFTTGYQRGAVKIAGLWAQ